MLFTLKVWACFLVTPRSRSSPQGSLTRATARSRPQPRRSVLTVEELEGRVVLTHNLAPVLDQLATAVPQGGFGSGAACEKVLNDIYNAGLQDTAQESPEFVGFYENIVGPALQQAQSGCGALDRRGNATDHNPTDQEDYGVAPREVRVPLKASGIAAWKKQAKRLAQRMQRFLPPGHSFKVTGVVKDGEHRRYKKMDVAIRGQSTWEELAAAASRAGFWVHAEGVTLNGKEWPLSPKATGPHLDLYWKK